MPSTVPTSPTAQTQDKVLDLSSFFPVADVTVAGRIVTVNGKRFVLTDETTFARLERAVEQATEYVGYIKKLEAERQASGNVSEIEGRIKAANSKLLTAKDEVIFDLKAALEKSQAADAAEKKARETAVKALDKTRKKLSFYRRASFGLAAVLVTAIAVFAAAK